MNPNGLHSIKTGGEDRDPKPGRLFIISAPSGGGKTTLCRCLLEHFQDLAYSVSFTTRKPRYGEKNGVDYFFISTEEFQRRISADQWAEWAEVHGNYYGTSAHDVDARLHEGKDVLLDIDVQGTLQLLKRYPSSITIFIIPPNIQVLKERMMLRGSDSAEVIQQRLAAAEKEMQCRKFYRHAIVNDRLEDAKMELIELITHYRKNKR